MITSPSKEKKNTYEYLLIAIIDLLSRLHLHTEMMLFIMKHEVVNEFYNKLW